MIPWLFSKGSYGIKKDVELKTEPIHMDRRQVQNTGPTKKSIPNDRDGCKFRKLLLQQLFFSLKRVGCYYWSFIRCRRIFYFGHFYIKDHGFVRLKRRTLGRISAIRHY